MKLPINIIARAAWKLIVKPALASAVVKGKLDKADVKEAVSDAVQAAVLKKLG
jgi:hypothetical protein